MKRYYIIIAFLILAACKPPMPEINETATNATPTTQDLLSLSEVIDEFSVLDADLGTDWKKEQISENMIPLTAIEGWTKRLKLLEDLTEKDSPGYKLVQARLEMLRSQAAYYLGAEIGEKGTVPLKLEGETFTPGLVACENVQDIEKSTKLYYISYKHYLGFIKHMDSVLQYNQEAREKIGVDETKPLFYDGPFNYGQKKIEAIQKAAEEQCGYVIVLEDVKNHQ